MSCNVLERLFLAIVETLAVDGPPAEWIDPWSQGPDGPAQTVLLSSEPVAMACAPGFGALFERLRPAHACSSI